MSFWVKLQQSSASSRLDFDIDFENLLKFGNIMNEYKRNGRLTDSYDKMYNFFIINVPYSKDFDEIRDELLKLGKWHVWPVLGTDTNVCCFRKK